MSHTPKTRAVAYARQRQLRADWFAENGPCGRCGSWEQLELDHIDPSTKIDHKIWTWKADRREEELKKCQALCHVCHIKKTAEDYMKFAPQIHGTWQSYKRTQSPCHCDLCRKAAAEYEHKRRMSMTRSKVISDGDAISPTSTSYIPISVARGGELGSTG